MAYKKLKYWFDKELAQMLANKIEVIKNDFNTVGFIRAVDEKVNDLELKDRVEIIADELNDNLDNDFKSGIAILSEILGPENPEETGMFSNFYWIMPIAKYVEKYGLEEWELSMAAIKEITKRNTGEYTIRPFLEKETKRTLRNMEEWSKDSNSHVRRLAMEGVRPRLPWAKKLDIFIKEPGPITPILNNLKDDPSKYVQKSVANCLNDILKDNQETGRQIISGWTNGNVSKERKWIIKHSLRNFLKKQDDWAVNLLHEL